MNRFMQSSKKLLSVTSDSMWIRRVLVALGLTVAATTAAVVPVASPAFAALSCPDYNFRIADGRWDYFFLGSNINIRTGPGTACPPVNGHFGLGQGNHWVQVDCWKNAGVGEGSWTHLWDDSIGVEGWTKDTLLSGDGAHVQCWSPS